MNPPMPVSSSGNLAAIPAILQLFCNNRSVCSHYLCSRHHKFAEGLGSACGEYLDAVLCLEDKALGAILDNHTVHTNTTHSLPVATAGFGLAH